jgi:hypothetical protein
MRRPVPAGRLNGVMAAEHGLSDAEAIERRQRFGRNDIVEAVPRPWRDLLRDTVKDPMIWFLAGNPRDLAARPAPSPTTGLGAWEGEGGHLAGQR